MNTLLTWWNSEIVFLKRKKHWNIRYKIGRLHHWGFLSPCLVLHLDLLHPLHPQLVIEPPDELLGQAVDLVPSSGSWRALGRPSFPWRDALQHLLRLLAADAGWQTPPPPSTAIRSPWRKIDRRCRARELVAAPEVVVGVSPRHGEATAGEASPQLPALHQDSWTDTEHTRLLPRHEHELQLHCALRIMNRSRRNEMLMMNSMAFVVLLLQRLSWLVRTMGSEVLVFVGFWE